MCTFSVPSVCACLLLPGTALQRDDDAGSSKKPRVVWSVEMHQQFVQAVNQLGIDSECCRCCLMDG
jgi:hypothetical protein